MACARSGVPVASLFIISLASGAGIWAAMAAGNLIAGYIPYARQVGAGLLIVAGIWLIITNRFPKRRESPTPSRIRSG